MAEEIVFSHVVTTKATLKLDEAELGALDALVGYGTDPFLESFYKVMGRSYLEPYEQGLRSLFDKIRNNVPCALSEARKARELLIREKQAKK